jgi:hypothetical protein
MVHLGVKNKLGLATCTSIVDKFAKKIHVKAQNFECEMDFQ